MNVSEFARRAGLSPSGVRWYESMGILPPPARRANGYRSYTEADVGRFTLVLTLRRLGLTPEAAGDIARTCFEGGTITGELAHLVADQRRAIARQREALVRLEVELGDLETTIEATAHADRRRTVHPAGPVSVLFVCNGNSARSQIGEALLGRFGGSDFEARSAGTTPKELHPLAVRVLAEVGIDWSSARAKSIEELLDRRHDYVITLSDSAREACPALPGPHSSLHWHLDDPAAVEGPEAVRLEAFRDTRSELSIRLRPFIEIARRAAGRPSSTVGFVGEEA
jgi:protein-tyrosine-phosphatase/DNA-binding transcriptional MerR regulator